MVENGEIRKLTTHHDRKVLLSLFGGHCCDLVQKVLIRGDCC